MTFNPTPAEASILAQVAQRESGNNYQAQNPSTTASGAYQFINSTWQMAAAATGVGTQYATAADAPASVQDINALWLLRYAGGNPNASVAWAASGPYTLPTGNGGSSSPLVDLSGTAASVSTSDILSSLGLTNAFTQMGIDPSSPQAGLAIALGIGVLGFAVMGVLNR